jgi:hypothetical protein
MSYQLDYADYEDPCSMYAFPTEGTRHFRIYSDPISVHWEYLPSDEVRMSPGEHMERAATGYIWKWKSRYPIDELDRFCIEEYKRDHMWYSVATYRWYHHLNTLALPWYWNEILHKYVFLSRLSQTMQLQAHCAMEVRADHAEQSVDETTMHNVRNVLRSDDDDILC